jgi:exopolysaccharide biosynthesis protein
MRRCKKQHFPLIYGTSVLLAASVLLLDAFVIPKKLAAVTPQGETTLQQAADNTGDTASAGQTGSETGSETAQNTATVTSTSYQDENMTITLTTQRVEDTNVYVADIQLSDISYLKTALAQNTYGLNIKETTSAMAEENGAVLAINGDYYGFRRAGYVLRNGTLYRDTSNNAEDLAILADGSFYTFDESEITAEEVQAMDALQIFSFGPVLVSGGEIAVDESTEVAQSKTSNPRTAIGCISPLHYIVVVSDGRTEESAGLSLYQLAGVFQQLGCTTAYNLDGGGSSTLWFNGEIVNNPTGGKAGNGSSERQVSDIVYFG